MAQIIAKVGNLTGEAFARDAAGNARRLKSGDVIREGETVVATEGAQVQLKMADGREMTVCPGETVKMPTIQKSSRKSPRRFPVAAILTRYWKTLRLVLLRVVKKATVLLSCCVLLKPLIRWHFSLVLIVDG